LKTKTPLIPKGKWSKWIFNAEYPRRLRRFLSTAVLATALGAIKDIFICLSLFLKYLKVKLGEDKEEPSLKILSTSLVTTLFFLGNMLKID
jgi:hypothetical protein